MSDMVSCFTLMPPSLTAQFQSHESSRKRSKSSGQHSRCLAVLSHFCYHSDRLHPLPPPCSVGCHVWTLLSKQGHIFKYILHLFLCVSLCLLCVCVHGRFPGGHDNFRKMIDEAEPLGYPVVVKNARGHRGKTLSQLPFISCQKKIFLLVAVPKLFADLIT